MGTEQGLSIFLSGQVYLKIMEGHPGTEQGFFQLMV